MKLTLPHGQQRALLAALLVHAGEVVATDRLIDELWGERPPPTAVGSLQNAVSQLRRLIGSELLQTRPPGYMLDVSSSALDVRRFEQLLGDAASKEPSVRAAALREALALWRGPALADCDEPFARSEAERLDALRLTANEERIEAELELGRHTLFVAELEALCAEHPLHERLWRQLALALYRSGRQADALAACREARSALDELGLEPSRELRELERDMLRQSPRLAVQAAAVEEEQEPDVGERRVVSVLAADLPDDDDPEALRATVQRVFDAAAAVVGRHGGTIERFGSEGLTAVFGAEESHEDDAMRAVRAAVELHTQTAVPVGVATGEAVVADEPHVTGAAFARAAALARSNTGVVVDRRTHDLVRDGVTVDGVTPATRVVDVRPGRPDARADVPLVGRESELAQLRAAFAAAASERRCVSVVVVGEAGIGKSRLARELAGSVDASVLVGRCIAYGEGATFLPLVEALAGVDPAALLDADENASLVAKRVAELTREGRGPSSLGESYWAVRRVLEALAGRAPVVLLLDDVHWAEPALLDLVEYLDMRVREAPLLVLCLARPELLEQRPGWTRRALPLGPLTDDDSRAVVAGTAGGLGEEGRERIVAVAEGNPLYAQQLAAFAAESGKALEPGAMPATLEAVLAGRLARLDPGERFTLQCAAVVGREFSRGAVAALVPPDRAVDAHLLALARRGFMHPSAELLSGDDAYRFDHVLLRDAAYATLTKAHRADLHERVATWLDRDGAGDDILVGYHLERAALLHRDLGNPAEALAAAAGDRLGSAGTWAWLGSGDGPAALNLLGRAAGVLPPGTRRAEIYFERAIVLHAVGATGDAGRKHEAAALDDAAAEAVAFGGIRIDVRVRLEQANMAMEQGRLSPDEFLGWAPVAISALEAEGDHRGLGRAWTTVSFAHGLRGEMEALGRAAARATHHYGLCGYSTHDALGFEAEALFYGSIPVDEATREAHRLLDETVDRRSEARVGTRLGALHAMAGRFDEARRLAAYGQTVYEELGLARPFAVALAPFCMEIERLAGDLDAAASVGRRSVDVLLGFGAGGNAATQAAALAVVELARGNASDAGRLLTIVKANVAEYDVLPNACRLGIEARLLARRGRRAAAESDAREAVRLLAGTDAVCERAQASLALAEVLALGGRHDEARKAAAEAERLLAAKGSVAGIARLREQLAAAVPS